MVQVLYADKDILVAVKPAGVESQAAAMAHTRARSRYPAEFPRTMRHTGVYVPAIRTKIII